MTEETAARLLQGPAGETIPLIQALVHYPLDVKPANPGQVMPRAWEARTRAFYAFRNQWKDQNDIIAQFYGRTGPGAGWKQPETGSFQIWAFGREMARKINDGAGKTGSRWFDNVVMLPDDPIDCWRRANDVIHSSLDPKTGAGSATIDMTDLYKIVAKEQVGGKDQEVRRDGGIRGLRAFAADYSGKSGSPGLFVVVDKITGGKTKQWLFQLPETNRDVPDHWKLDSDDHSFTVRWKDGASIQAVFVSPGKMTITRSSGVRKAHPLSGVADVNADVVVASGQNPVDGDFFVVLSVRDQGPAPAVNVTGAGLNATATIGEQTIRFDGTKIVVGR
jgi:hypothetical protein